jgi:uncharacterized repeat protein (TIGR01451 family)
VKNSSLKILLTICLFVLSANAATFTVTTTSDSGAGSLRQAIADAVAGDTISFSLPNGSTIVLTSGQLSIEKSLTIDGPGANALTVSGNNASRVFNLVSGANVTISGITISNGAVGDLGGGIYHGSGTLAITDCIISGNTAFGHAGGILNTGTLTLTDSIVSNNTAGFAGGIDNGGTLTIVRSTFSGNSAIGSPGRGGSIYNAGTLTVEDSTFSGSSAVDNGGAIYNVNSIQMRGTTISNNTAGLNGGGIYNTASSIITNSTLSGNTAVGTGGGVFNLSSVRFSNSTIAGNSAGTVGGVANVNFGGTSYKNSIVAGGASGINCAGGLDATGVNYSTDSSCSGFTQVTPAQLGLGALADNGGPTLTHALTLGSSAVDAATDCTDGQPVPIVTDQRGVSRPQGAACDAGAFELESNDPTPTPTPDPTPTPTPTPDPTPTPNLPPVISITPLTQDPVQYSDPIAPVTISVSSPYAQPSELGLSFNYSKDGGPTAPGTPAGLSITDIGVSGNSRTFTLAGTMQVGAGTYLINASTTDPVGGGTATESFTIVVTHEDVTVTPAPENPAFVDISGGTGSATLCFDLANVDDGFLGDLNRVAPGVQIVRVDGLPGADTISASPWIGRDATRYCSTATFTNTPFGAYEIRLVAGGNYYSGLGVAPIEVIDLAAFRSDLLVGLSVSNLNPKQGEVITYTLTVRNFGPNTAFNTVVNDVLSSGTTFVSARANRGNFTAPPSGQAGTVTWYLGNLASDGQESAQIEVTVVVKGKTAITNTATVSSLITDPNLANNSASITTTVAAGGSGGGGGKRK